jgi:uncharacterized cupredoxin-like copper-binding protein
MGSVTHRAALFAMLALMLTAAACSSEDNGGSTGGTGGATGATASATTVDVTLKEFGILPATDSAVAGDVTFDVTNQGPKDTHEFVVIKTDLAPNALPTKADGSVNEEAAGLSSPSMKSRTSRSATRRHSLFRSPQEATS